MGFSPNTTLSTLRPDLAEFVEFDTAADRGGYIARLVAPIADTALQSDNPGKLPIEALLANLDGTSTLRASGSGYKRDDFEFEKFTYATQEHGWEQAIDDRDLKRYQHIIGGVERVATERALHRVIGNYEKRVADLLFNTTTWTGASLTTAVGTAWTTHATATPVTDIMAAKRKVYAVSGLDANAVWFNRTVFEHLRECDQVQDILASAGAGETFKASSVTAQKLAELFDVKHVFVAGGTTNTANPGQAATPGRIWGNGYAMVGRVAETADMREPCVARTFHWTEDGSRVGGAIETYRDETVRGDVVRVRMDSDEVVMYAQAAHLLSGVA